MPLALALEAALVAARKLVEAAFTRVDIYHGLAHAEDVEQRVIDICAQPDIDVTDEERFLVRAAAILHDIGYAAYDAGTWSQDRREHIRAGLDRITVELPALPVFRDQPEAVQAVLFLVAFHDDTNYQYPSVVWEGRVCPVELGNHTGTLAAYEAALAPNERDRLLRLLRILQEADAITATNTAGALRTLNYSVDRGIPLFAPGNPLNAWCWEESAVGNVRVAAKRLLIDAISTAGKAAGRTYCEAVEAVIRDICAEHGVDYLPETAPMAQTDVDSEFQILRYSGWPALEAALRDVGLRGDQRLKPYAKATIRPRRVAIHDVRPASYYALNRQILGHHRLLAGLERGYALSLFDLTGMIEYALGEARFNMAPPLVETYYEEAEGGVVSVVVDGLHRVLLARELGLSHLWVVEISDLPREMPLVPLPLRWEDVTLYDAVPPMHAKRKFRYPTLESFPDVSGLTDVPISEENYLYFFYRDLSRFGSTGIREAR